MREYFKYTLIAVALSFITKYLVFVTDPMHTGLGKLYMVIAPLFMIAVLYPALVATRNKEFGGYISGKLASAAGVRIAVFAGIFNGLFDYLYYTVINVNILPIRLAEAIANAKTDPNINTPELLKQAEGGAANFFTPFMQTTFPMFITIAAGFFFTVVFAYIVRKYPKGGKMV